MVQASASSETNNMFDNLLNTAPTSSYECDELECYLATDVEDVKDGLAWWYERHAMFPHLSCMAQDYLSIPGEFIKSFFFYPLC